MGLELGATLIDQYSSTEEWKGAYPSVKKFTSNSIVPGFFFGTNFGYKAYFGHGFGIKVYGHLGMSLISRGSFKQDRVSKSIFIIDLSANLDLLYTFDINYDLSMSPFVGIGAGWAWRGGGFALPLNAGIDLDFSNRFSLYLVTRIPIMPSKLTNSSYLSETKTSFRRYNVMLGVYYFY